MKWCSGGMPSRHAGRVLTASANPVELLVPDAHGVGVGAGGWLVLVLLASDGAFGGTGS